MNLKDTRESFFSLIKVDVWTSLRVMNFKINDDVNFQ